MFKTITLGLTNYNIEVSLNNLNRTYEITIIDDSNSKRFRMVLDRDDMQKFAYFVHDSMNCSFDFGE